MSPTDRRVGKWVGENSDLIAPWRHDAVRNSLEALVAACRAEERERIRREVENFYPPCDEQADLSARECAANAVNAVCDALPTIQPTGGSE